jgi:hypothetical protein
VEGPRGPLVAALADGLQVPMAGSWRRQSSGKVGGKAQPTGFGGQLFSPGAARRGCGTGLNGGWFSGGGKSVSNLTARLEVLMDGATSRLPW